MIQDLIHKQIIKNKTQVDEWFSQKTKDLNLPFYMSFDIRDSGQKVAPVDANIFPAGFNNICQTDKESAVELVASYLQRHYPDLKKQMVLLTEEHTSNRFYWENVGTLKDLIEGAGWEVSLAIPRLLEKPLAVESASGRQFTVHSAQRDGDEVMVDGVKPSLIISNNDFSEEYAEWAEGLKTPMNPPHELGWYRRKKFDFFKAYNQLAEEFAKVIGIDPWHLHIDTELYSHFDVTSDESRDHLADKVDEVIAKLREQSQQHDVTKDPFVFVKNNSGTYGLGVIQAHSGDEVRSWNYKARKKMKASKGGKGVQELIVQEGIPTVVTSSGETAEPAIYMVGCQLAGGFLRTHQKKGPEDNLNSPGAVFRRLCVSDLAINIEGLPMENVYGWVAKLGFLAVAKEVQNIKS